MRRAIGLLAVAIAIALAACGDDDDAYDVRFVFRDAGGLRKGDDIRIHGVRAGRIDGVRLIAGDRALVSGHLDGGAGVVGAGARARSRPTGLLGEQYVDLSTGDVSRPLPSGTRIGIAATGRAVTLSQTLDLLDAPTRARLQLLISESATALAGHGTDLSRLLARLPDTVEQTEQVVAQLRRRRHALRDLVARADGLLAPTAARRADLGRLAEEAAAALSTVAGKRRQLAAGVTLAPAALDRLRHAAVALRTSARRLAPTSRTIVAAAPPLQRLLSALPGFRRDVDDVLTTIEQRSPEIRAFARDALAPLRSVTRTSDALASFSTTAKPILDVLGAGGTTELFRFVDGFAQTMEATDGVGSLVRLRTVLGAAQRRRDANAARPGEAPRKRRPKLPAVAAPKPADPASPTTAGPAAGVQGIGDQVGTTVNRLLDFLLAP